MSGTNRTLHLALLSCLLTSANMLFSQAVSGTINGYVSDTSDAAVAGANVTITNVSTGAATTRVTDATGLFVASNLLPGTYSVSVEAVGFRRFLQENVVLRIDSTVRVDARLDLGAVTEQVTVSAVATVLKTEKTDVRSVHS